AFGAAHRECFREQLLLHALRWSFAHGVPVQADWVFGRNVDCCRADHDLFGVRAKRCATQHLEEKDRNQTLHRRLATLAASRTARQETPFEDFGALELWRAQKPHIDRFHTSIADRLHTEVGIFVTAAFLWRNAN